MDEHDDLHIIIDDGVLPPELTSRSGSDKPADGGAELAPAAHAIRAHDQLAVERAQVSEQRARLAVEAERQAAIAAERDAAMAYDSGDSAAAAAAQRRMAQAEARAIHFEGEAEHHRSRAEVPLPPSDPVERLIKTRTPLTAKWLRDHPDHARSLALHAAGRASGEDRRRAEKLNAAHSDAIAEGIEPDSDRYFAHVQKFIGIKDGGNNRSRNNNGPTVTQRRASYPDNYNPGDPSTHISDGGNQVVLTAGEARAAVDGSLIWNAGPKKGQVLGVVEVARRKKAMMAEGRYNKLG